MGPEYEIRNNTFTDTGSGGYGVIGAFDNVVIANCWFTDFTCACCGQSRAHSPFERVCQACQWCEPATRPPEAGDGA